jgi:hypothetical protein
MKFIFTLAFTTLAISILAVPPTVALSVHPPNDGYLQIIASTTLTVQRYNCVFQSSTDFVSWTAISTNEFSNSLTATNIVQTTNTATFYRAEAVAL